MGFGYNLKALRGLRTIESVATAIGVSTSSYIKYEREERCPRDAVKSKIAAYYGVTVQEIFFAADEH